MAERRETICSRIKQAWHLIARVYNNEAVLNRITLTTAYVLINIDSSNGTPSTKIGPLMGMEATSLSRTLSLMESRKLIERVKDKNDRRVVRIKLTKNGKLMKEHAKEIIKKFNKELEDNIDPTKLAVFNEVINSISQIAEKAKLSIG